MFDNVHKNFGFGCMRLPLLENGEVNYPRGEQRVSILGLDMGEMQNCSAEKEIVTKYFNETKKPIRRKS